MKSTIKVSISGIAFNLENDAYTVLKNYLDRIESTFSETEEGREIISDIELRVAELFSAKIQSPEEAITLAMVNDVLEILGSVDDILGDEEQPRQNSQSTNKEQKTTKKRLFRDIDNRMIGGVCSGLAAYFSIDRVWIRLGFLGMLFLGMFGFASLFAIVVGYFLLWIIMPAARTMQEKMTMRKEPILQSDVETDNARKSHKNDLGSVLGRIIAGFFRVIGWIVFGFIAFIALVLLLSLPFGLITGNASFGDWGYLELADLQQFISIPMWLIAILITLVITLPLLAGIYLLCKLLFRFKTKIRFGLILFLVWIVSLLSIVGITTYIVSNNDVPIERFFSQPTANYGEYVKELPLSEFKQFSAAGSFDVIAVKSDTNYLRLETTNRIGEKVHIEQQGEKVSIKYMPKSGRDLDTRAKLYLYFTNLEKIDLSIWTNFSCSDTLALPSFDAKINGAASANLFLNTTQSEFELTGRGFLKVAGSSTNSKIEVSGAAKVRAFDYLVDSLDVRLSGAGDLKIHAVKHLKANVSGAADIRYKGSPTTDINKSGVVRIKKVD